MIRVPFSLAALLWLKSIATDGTVVRDGFHGIMSPLVFGVGGKFRIR